MTKRGTCEDCGMRRELSYAGPQRGNVCAECRESYHEETDEERADRGAPPKKKNPELDRGEGVYAIKLDADEVALWKREPVYRKSMISIGRSIAKREGMPVHILDGAKVIMKLGRS